MAQKQTKILDEALNAFSAGEYQWSMELADMLLAINKDDEKAKSTSENEGAQGYASHCHSCRTKNG